MKAYERFLKYAAVNTASAEGIEASPTTREQFGLARILTLELKELGLGDAARQIKDGVSDFQKGNMRLSLALTLVKEEMK